MIVSKIQTHQNSEPRKKFQGKIIKTQTCDVKCDECGSIKKLAYYNIIEKRVNNKGKDLCSSCSAKQSIKEGKRKTWTTSRNHDLKNKSYDEIYGEQKSKTIRKKISLNNGKFFDGKTWEDVWGVEVAHARKHEFSKLRKGKTFDEISSNAAEWRANISKATAGKNNPMYGKPSPQGSGNGWSGWYKDIYFRSLLELSYIKSLFDDEIKFENGEQKKYLIKYFDSHKKITKNYFPDFYLIDGDQFVEIKPKRLLNSQNNKDKFAAAKKKYGSKFIILTEKDIKKLNFEQIKILYENKELKFLDRYEKKFIQLCMEELL